MTDQPSLFTGSAPLTIEAIAQRLTGVKGDVEIG
jgi:hypothetical protein